MSGRQAAAPGLRPAAVELTPQNAKAWRDKGDVEEHDGPEGTSGQARPPTHSFFSRLRGQPLDGDG
jgi:hypothetical protein